MKKIMLWMFLIVPLNAQALIFDMIGATLTSDSIGSQYGIQNASVVTGFVIVDDNFIVNEFQINAGTLTGYNLDSPAVVLSDGGVLSEWVESGKLRTGEFDDTHNSIVYYAFNEARNVGYFGFHTYKGETEKLIPEFSARFDMTQRQALTVQRIDTTDVPLPEPNLVFALGLGALLVVKKFT